MNGSIGSIVLSGFGNGTFAGSPSLCLTLGYGVGEAAATPVTGSLHFTTPQRNPEFTAASRNPDFTPQER